MQGLQVATNINNPFICYLVTSKSLKITKFLFTPEMLIKDYEERLNIEDLWQSQ